MPVIQIGRCAICQRDGVKCRAAGGWLGLRRCKVGHLGSPWLALRLTSVAT